MKRFSVVTNGYDIDEVNRFIDIVIGRLERLNAENNAYVLKIEKLNKQISEERNMDEKLSKAIIAVQETSDRMKSLAKEESTLIIEEAKRNATSIVHEALIKAEKIEHEALIMKKNINIYKGKYKSLLESQLALTNEIDEIDI